MDNVLIIAAIGKNNELGYNNNLIWHLPRDLKYFKKMTNGKTIIMGRKCFESLPGLLPNRKHIILTKNLDYKVDGALVFHSVDEVLDYINKTNEECFIIGGSQIYYEFLPYAKVLYLTEIKDEARADAFFPKFDKKQYSKKTIETLTDEDVTYSFTKYEKR